MRNVLPLCGLLWLAPHIADEFPVGAWLLAPAIGLLLYRTTIVMHDCTHRTLFKSKQLNYSVGAVLGALTGIDFASFTLQHWRHHRRYGEQDDPQGFHYLNLRTLSRARFRWHLVKPLLGWNLRHTLRESLLAPRNWRRSLVTGEIAVIAIVQLALLTTVTGRWEHPLLALLPFISSGTCGLFFSQLRGIAEHGAADADDAAGNVRSHAAHWLDGLVLYDLNFNYHREHHNHPEVPSHHLPLIYRANSMIGSSLAPSMFGTLHALSVAAKKAHV